MKLAEDWLGVPMVLEPRDMCNPNVDELSMMTYLSQFPEASLKPGAPIKSRADASKVKVFGPGVEGGLDTNTPAAEFTVDVTAAGGSGKPNVSVTSPEGAIECSCDDNKDGTFSCAYIPTVPGCYTVAVACGGKPAGNSPYKVTIAGLPVGSGLTIPVGDLSKVKVEGLEKELTANRETEFVVDATAAGPAELAVEVLDGDGAPVATETETLAPQKWKVKCVCFSVNLLLVIALALSVQIYPHKGWPAHCQHQVLWPGAAGQSLLCERV
jgi:filamin